MWFDTKKINEDENLVIYNYGFETHELTGSFSLSKDDGTIKLIKKDKDYSENIFKWIVGHVQYRFPKENYPEKRMIATG
jgi:hypothetical protein